MTASKNSIEPESNPKELDYRNLLWTIYSEPLIPDLKATLAPIDTKNEEDLKYELSDFLSHKPHSHRLGVYFENLIEFYIKHILKSKAVYAHEKTKNGEIDFIFLDPSSQRYKHWEVALKFYFYEPENNLYWGRTRRDRFDIKTDRIINRQLAYSQDPEFCKKLYIEPQMIDRELVYKGKLFYPRGHKLCQSFSYVRGMDEFNKLEKEFKNDQFRSLTKREWLSDPVEFPLQFSDIETPGSYGIKRDNGNHEHFFILENQPDISHN